MGDEPAFEVRDREGKYHYKIWADGRIDGFGKGMIVYNRIPRQMNAFARRAIEQQSECEPSA